MTEFLAGLAAGVLLMLVVFGPKVRQALKNDARDPKTGKFIKLGK